ncbi:hypothetical protein ACRRTK_024250 [Alexandromys fortis]
MTLCRGGERGVAGEGAETEGREPSPPRRDLLDRPPGTREREPARPPCQIPAARGRSPTPTRLRRPGGLARVGGAGARLRAGGGGGQAGASPTAPRGAAAGRAGGRLEAAGEGGRHNGGTGPAARSRARTPCKVSVPPSPHPHPARDQVPAPSAQNSTRDPRATAASQPAQQRDTPGGAGKQRRAPREGSSPQPPLSARIPPLPHPAPRLPNSPSLSNGVARWKGFSPFSGAG